MARIRALAVGSALVLLLAGAPAARAATLALETGEMQVDSAGHTVAIGILRLRAEPGEANDVTLIARADRSFVATDRGAPLHAGSSCTRRRDGSVRCAGFVDRVRMLLGDGDDRIEVNDHRRHGPELELAGGAGDDELHGGSLADSIDGGDGADRVMGGGGEDRLVMGEPSPTAGDRVDGGPGRDVADWTSQGIHRGHRGVRVDLARGIGGVAGSPDHLASVEAVVGTRGRDVLRGGPGDDGLFGVLGRDAIAGGGGNDTIDLTLGVARGGPGDDVLDARHGPATLDCGAGNDRFGGGGPPARAIRRRSDRGRIELAPHALAATEGRHTLLVGCERVSLHGVDVTAVPVRTPRGALAFAITCPPRRADPCDHHAVAVRVRTPPADVRRQPRGPFALPLGRGGAHLPPAAPDHGGPDAHTVRAVIVRPRDERSRRVLARRDQVVGVHAAGFLGDAAWLVRLPPPS